MKTYQSHKQVLAAKIKNVEQASGDSGVILYLEGDEHYLVTWDWISKHSPDENMQNLIGGYVVQYPDSDDYTSWSPGDVFERGNIELPNPEQDEVTVNVMATINNMGTGLKALCDNMHSVPFGVDPRMVAMAKTSFQMGLMQLRRSIDEEKW